MNTARRLEIAARLIIELKLQVDRLPYSPTFDDVYARYCLELGREISRHEFWWAMVSVRKRGMIGPSRRRPRTPRGEAAFDAHPGVA